MKFKTRAIRFNQYQSEGSVCVLVWIPFFFFSQKNNWITLVMARKINCNYKYFAN